MKTYVRKGTDQLGKNQVLMWVKVNPYEWFMVDELGQGRQIEGFYGLDKVDGWEPNARSFDVYEFE